MNKVWGKIGPLMALSMVFCVSYAKADEKTNKHSRFQKKRAEKKQEDSPRVDQNEVITNQPITPSGNPFGSGPDFFIQAEALYLRATEDNLNAGLKTQAPLASNFINGPSVNADYDWRWGARGALGFNTGHDGWDLSWKWLWFRSNHNQNHAANATTNLFLQSVATFNPVGSPVGSEVFVSATSLSTKLRLLVNVGDFELGREFFISKWLKLRPHLGARGVWISRNLYTRTGGFVNLNASGTNKADSEINSNTTLVKQEYKVHLHGGGMYLGLNTDWGFAKGWSIFGLFDQSLIYGRNHVTSSESQLDTGKAEYTRSQITNNQNVVRSITDLSLGLRWSHTFSNERFRLLLQAAWEEHLFYNFNEFNLSNRTGNLALTGASFGARFDF